MKRLSALFLTLALGTALSAQAQAPAAAPAGPSKIAVIAFQAAVSQTNEFQRNFADLQKKYDPKRQQIQALSTEIENLEKQLQAQGDKLSDAERASKSKTLEEKQKQDAEEDDSGDPESPQARLRRFHRQLRRIRRGEPVDRLVLRV